MHKLFISTIIAIFSISSLSNAQSADKHFEGAFVGADIGLEDSGDFYYGGALGYRFQGETNIVFGVEGTFGDLTTSATVGNISENIGNVWSATGILGFAFGDENRNLVSINAGYGELDITRRTNGAVSDSASFGGFRGSFGYERAFKDNLSVRVQGTYQDVGDLGQAYIGTVGVLFKF
ncbi:outer membrane protein [Kordiimonas sp. SCSIO 12610]|uniref:outer membrane protein n=1 Tax=Kordiimonas sp. SCSIO 12610 TaxID=2829597 RepID=UPI00210A456B|nr:outer membrane beta-barrel protein [Kordiimonas sp. SCSIO 12610]UTW54572.1 hypothetical protein KFF44_12270 [Kordiimonas sp. SCSIO 12610]